LNNKTVLIFGCTGQDGSLLSRSLLKKGSRVIGTTRKKKKSIANFSRLGIEKDVLVKEIDINCFEEVEKLIETFSPEQIYNLSCQSSVGKSFSNPKETLDSTIKSTLNILEVAKQTSYSGNLFFAGSGEIYGHTDVGATLESIQQPSSPYAVGKQTSFNLVKLYREIYCLKCLTGVLFNHESPLRPKSFITQKIIQGAKDISEKKKTKLTIGNIDVIRDWGWAPEYVEAMQAITDSGLIKDQIICTGRGTRLKIFISKVFSFYGLNWKNFIEIDKSFFRPNEIMQNYGNPERLNKELGWKSETQLDTIIEKLINKSLY
jgi:GDPmannose 4,6-dehydratase